MATSTATCSVSGYIPCGNWGCILSNRCCFQPASWGCSDGHACYTALDMIDCYSTASPSPTVTKTCYNYADGDGKCVDDSTCIYCASVTAAYCSTNIFISRSQTLTAVGCGSVQTVLTKSFDGTSLVVLPGSATSGSTATSLSISLSSSGSGSISPQTTLAPSAASAASAASTSSTTQAPAPSHLSGGAIAGIAIGACFAIALIGILAFFLWKKQNTPAKAPTTAPVPVYQTPPGYPISPGYQAGVAYQPTTPYSPGIPDQHYYVQSGKPLGPPPEPTPGSEQHPVEM